MCSTVEGVQYSGGYQVHWRDFISTVEDISTVEGYHQYGGGLSSVQWRIFSTVEGYHQYSAVSTEKPTDDIPPLY